MLLRSGFILIAQKLQEAADMAHSNVRAMLADAVNDAHRGTGKWASYVDHTGDGESGDCVYNCDGDMKSAPYEITTVGGKSAANLDTANAKKVVPMTSYQETADDDDHYAAMSESLKASNIYQDLPLYERFISKTERAGADAGSFAGKGKSFPILKPADVGAAIHAMGRAGADNYGAAQLKANIIRIAKAKGWTSELPKAWQGGDEKTTEAKNVSRETSGGSVRLVESAVTLDPIILREARADYEIKLIAPGKGSSAFYPAEVLKRDGPNVFRAGTHVYVNHPTLAEEAQRPEGDVKNLAGVLTTDAAYHESHAKGPGLYGRMKVFADHGNMVEEKASHVGMSIRACGEREAAGKMRDGVPILAKLTSAESVDIVTRAGAGGMILTESAKANTGDEDMTDVERTQLREAAKLILHEGARRKAVETLADVSLTEAGKNEVVRRCLESIPTKDGLLDEAALVERVKAESKAVGAFLASVMPGGVRFMGTAPVQISEADAKAQRKAAKRLQESAEGVFAELMGNPEAAKFAAGRAA
jgi:hypothetical protein